MWDENVCLDFCIIFNALLFVVVVVINGLASAVDRSGGLFIQGIANVSKTFTLDITPAGATFAIWGLIYAWQAVWIINSLVSICRRTPEGPAYITPTLLPLGFFISYILNLCANIAWLFLWDREEIVASLFVLLAMSVTLYVCIGISYIRLSKNTDYLLTRNRKNEIYLIRFLVQNGLATYAAWVTIATLLNLGVVLVYSLPSPVNDPRASTICLGVLTVEISLFFIVDLIFLVKVARFVFMPYVVIVIALIGITAENWNPGKTNSIFTVIHLSVSILLLLIKVVRIFAPRRDERSGYSTETKPILK